MKSRARNKNSPWTSSLVKRLTALVVEGNTASSAATVLGLPRAAVIGKARRLGMAFGHGLSPEASERWATQNHVHRSIGEEAKPKTKKPPKPSRTSTEAKRAPQVAPNTDTIEGVPDPIGPIESYPEDSPLNPSTCRYVHGDVGKPGWRWCGHPTIESRPYCHGHAMRFYTKARPRAHSLTPRRRHASKGRFGVFT